MSRIHLRSLCLVALAPVVLMGGVLAMAATAAGTWDVTGEAVVWDLRSATFWAGSLNGGESWRRAAEGRMAEAPSMAEVEVTGAGPR